MHRGDGLGGVEKPCSSRSCHGSCSYLLAEGRTIGRDVGHEGWAAIDCSAEQMPSATSAREGVGSSIERPASFLKPHARSS